MKTKRLFIAIPIGLDEANLEHFASLQKRLNTCVIKWVEPHNFHLTLKFLGDTDLALVNKISFTLQNVATEFNPFELELNNLGAFYRNMFPSVIWIAVKNQPVLTDLAKSIYNNLLQLFPGLDKRFAAHITLGRVKFWNKHNDVKQIFTNNTTIFHQKLNISSFHLIESNLTSHGPKYKTLEKFYLKPKLTNS